MPRRASNHASATAARSTGQRLRTGRSHFSCISCRQRMLVSRCVRACLALLLSSLPLCCFPLFRSLFSQADSALGIWLVVSSSASDSSTEHSTSPEAHPPIPIPDDNELRDTSDAQRPGSSAKLENVEEGEPYCCPALPALPCHCHHIDCRSSSSHHPRTHRQRQ